MTENRTTPWYRRGPDPDLLPSGRIPESHYLVGSADVPLRVFIRRRAWDEIQQFAETTGGEEQGGILVGRVYEDSDGPFIIVAGAIPARHGRPTPDGVTFTQQAWDEMETVMQYGFASELVIGWFHTHPGMGASLSGYDRFTAHRFFPEWWQLTYVVDPIRQRQGLFHWRNGDLQPLPGFWVCEDDISSVPDATITALVAAAAVQGEAPETTRLSVARPSAMQMLFAAACLVLIAIAFLPLPGSLSSFNANVREYATETERLSEQLGELRERHAVLQRAMATLEEPGSPAPGSGTTASRPGDTTVVQADRSHVPLPGHPADRVLHAAHAPVNASVDAPTGTPVDAPFGASVGAPIGAPVDALVGASVAAPGDAPGVSTRGSYVVRSGDTLWSISERLLGDPYAYGRVADVNKLGDPDLILPGWELHLPERSD